MALIEFLSVGLSAFLEFGLQVLSDDVQHTGLAFGFKALRILAFASGDNFRTSTMTNRKFSSTWIPIPAINCPCHYLFCIFELLF